jgi:hypothetical protein
MFICHVSGRPLCGVTRFFNVLVAACAGGLNPSGRAQSLKTAEYLNK